MQPQNIPEGMIMRPSKGSLLTHGRRFASQARNPQHANPTLQSPNKLNGLKARQSNQHSLVRRRATDFSQELNKTMLGAK